MYFFLCFGQSNMSGQADASGADNSPPDRLKVLAAAAHSGRTVGEIYPAVPPLAHSGSKMGPADFFGRKMVSVLPENITVVIINVSIGGQSIELFQPNVNINTYIAEQTAMNSGFSGDWWAGYLNEYGGDLYARMVAMGKKAEELGKLKGILLHQGEADWTDVKPQWPSLVKNTYDSLVRDIGVNADEVPLLVGELGYENQGGDMGWFNGEVISQVPSLIPNSYVISADGCPMLAEASYTLHFTRQGYEMLGERYADKMLELLGY